MVKLVRFLLVSAFVSALLCLGACVPPDETETEPDTGTPVADAADTGTPPVDTGTPVADTGTPPVDAGSCSGLCDYRNCPDARIVCYPGTSTPVCECPSCDGHTLCTVGNGACTRTGVYVCATGSRECSVATPVEICSNGIDDNCNGQVDEGCGSSNCGGQTAGTACSAGVGACMRHGVWLCTSSSTGQCSVSAPVEICGNDIDDDCNGTIDDGCAPVCHRAPEVCNGLDDDCDGVVDNGFPDLSCGLGACSRTVAQCVGGRLQACTPGTPSVETCNGIDDDCDNVVDNVAPRTCYDGPAGTLNVGRCIAGVQTCSAGSWSGCLGEVVPTAEICGNYIDDDCDGVVDDGCLSSLAPRELRIEGSLACSSGATPTVWIYDAIGTRHTFAVNTTYTTPTVWTGGDYYWTIQCGSDQLRPGGYTDGTPATSVGVTRVQYGAANWLPITAVSTVGGARYMRTRWY